MKCFVLISFLFSLSLFAFDSNRPFTARLSKHARSRFDEYELPFLRVASGASYSFDVETLVKRLKETLKKTRFPVRSHFSKGGEPANVKNLPIPRETTQGNQLEGIQTCSIEKCQMKLSDKVEKEKVAKASNKVEAYHQLVIDRVNRYLTKHELAGYEERSVNSPTVRKMLRATKFFERSYPSEASFFDSGLWKGTAKPIAPVETFLRGEMLIMAPDRMQPVWRVSEVFEFREKDTRLLVELHLYTNHYFDASLRIFEALSMPNDPKRSILVVTDVMEIDELKKSALIRTLYTGKMVEAVTQSQDEIIDGIDAQS